MFAFTCRRQEIYAILYIRAYNMKIQFLGTAAAEGVPAVFCNCGVCRDIRRLGATEFRTRSQVIIDGVLSVDFPPDAYAHSLKFGTELSKLRYLFVTHSHMDHFYAHDFILRGYKYAELAEKRLEIFGNKEVKAVFSECTAREMKNQVAPNLNFNLIEPYREYRAGDYRVLTVPARHSLTEDCLLFYVEKEKKGYLHMCDTALPDDSVYDFLAEKGAKPRLVALDCTFGANRTEANARHMSIYDDMQVKNKMLAAGIIDADTKIVITHFSHNCNPTRNNLNYLERHFGVAAAYDGFQTEI